MTQEQLGRSLERQAVNTARNIINIINIISSKKLKMVQLEQEVKDLQGELKKIEVTQLNAVQILGS